MYIDSFAGSGTHKSKRSGEFVPGSPLNAILVMPPFREYFFIDLNAQKVAELEKLALERPDVHVMQGDCNRLLVEDVFPYVRYEDYRRGLCVLDPYGLHLDWNVISTAAKMRSIEIFLNFPVADINRNVLWHERERVAPEQVARMDAFWGDDSWVRAAYSPTKQEVLFGPSAEDKATNEQVAMAFRQRLNKVSRLQART